MKLVKEIMNKNKFVQARDVNNVKKDILNNVTTFNVNVNNKERAEKIKYNAEKLAADLEDFKNLNYYLKISKEHKPEFLRECFSIAKQAKQEGKITTTIAKYFVGIVKKRSGK